MEQTSENDFIIGAEHDPIKTVHPPIECVVCTDDINEDMVAPVYEGPMHVDCFIEWMDP